MVSNIYKFRRVKWGDPKHKLQMLPAERQREPFNYFPLIVVIVFISVFVATIAGLRILA